MRQGSHKKDLKSAKGVKPTSEGFPSLYNSQQYSRLTEQNFPHLPIIWINDHLDKWYDTCQCLLGSALDTAARTSILIVFSLSLDMLAVDKITMTEKKLDIFPSLYGPPPVKIHDEDRVLISVMSSRKKGKPAFNHPLQSKQAGGGTPLCPYYSTNSCSQSSLILIIVKDVQVSIICQCHLGDGLVVPYELMRVTLLVDGCSSVDYQLILGKGFRKGEEAVDSEPKMNHILCGFDLTLSWPEVTVSLAREFRTADNTPTSSFVIRKTI
ncbi:hypothetical protein J6590_066852 [Homalodisca vitripennis]|nr:hypothetical protein J6590_066852 [Homalodisca vitripennis]